MDGLPLQESAVLGCAIFTAYGAVRHGADLRGGERVAIVATGGVGINVIQIAKAFGASQIIAVDIRDEKLDAVVVAVPWASERAAYEIQSLLKRPEDRFVCLSVDPGPRGAEGGEDTVSPEGSPARG